MSLRESGKKLEDTVSHLEGEVVKARQLSAQTQETFKHQMEEERYVVTVDSP